MEDKTMNSGNPNDYPMKWHKFLIYFSLWFGALANVVSGLRYITGTVYGADSERVYSVFPSMKSIDLVMGVILICMAVFALITRFALAGFKAKGPGYLQAYYLLSPVIGIGYILLTSSVTHLPFSQLGGTDLWASAAIGIAFFIANKTYYNKRRMLFCN